LKATVATRENDRDLQAVGQWTAGAAPVTAAVGSVASRDTSSVWYRGLDEPVIQPGGGLPDGVEPSLLRLAVTSAVALNRADAPETQSYRPARAVNKLLNASWSCVSFKAHRIGLAIGVATALAVSSGDLVRRTFRMTGEPAGPCCRTRAGAALPLS